MKLQQFNGGLATRLNPQFLALNEAQDYLNIDNSTGSLTPVKDKLATGLLTFPYNWYSSSLARWFSSNSYTVYAELDNKVYSSDGVDVPQVHDTTGSYSVGITPPGAFTGNPIILSTPVTDVTLSAVISVVATALPNQEITYLLVNDNAGVYSSAFEVSISVSAIAKTKAELRINPKAGKPTELQYKAAADAAKRVITISLPRTETIGSNGVRVFRQYKGFWRLVGVLASYTASLVDSLEDISAGILLDTTKYSSLQGVYQYVLTYYDNLRGRESGPSEVTAELNLATSGQISFSNLPVSLDSTVTHKRLYRVGADVTSFSLVTELPNATAAFTDNVSDTNIGDLLTTQIYLPASEDINYLVTANGMLFGAEGARVRYTPIGQPEAWPELYYITFESTVTSLAVVFTGILVCTLTKTYIITGSGPNSLAMSGISTDQGCLSHTSMQVLKGSALWVSYEGICVSSGDAVKVISRVQLGRLSLNPVDSILVNEVYHVLNADGISYCFDTVLGPVFKKLNYGIATYAKKDSVLYGYLDGRLYLLEQASTNLAFRYLSPKFIEGSFTEAKLYKQVYIYSKGDIIIKVYIDDVLVATKELNTEDSHTVYAPQEQLRGHFIQFDITGTGEVLEIEYTAGRAKS